MVFYNMVDTVFLTLNTNLTRGSFVKFSCNMKYETMFWKLSYFTALKIDLLYSLSGISLRHE